MQTFLNELGLESAAVALEESLGKLNRLANRLEAARGVSQGMAMEAERLLPGFISPRRPIGYFTEAPSRNQYRVSLEEISKGMWAAIAVAIAAAFAAVVGLIFSMLGDDSYKAPGTASHGGAGGGNGSGPSAALPKAVEAVEKAATTTEAANDAFDVLLSNQHDAVNDAIIEAVKLRLVVDNTALEDIATHAHAGLGHFSVLDFDMLQQHGLYALLYADRGMARTANTLLKPAINDSSRISDEFDRTSPDYKHIAETLVRMRANRVIGSDWDEGLSFSDYVQMLINHRENNAEKPLTVRRLSDFTEMVRAHKQHSEKNYQFFKDLLKENGDILENLAHDAQALSKRANSIQTGASSGTAEDSKALVQESQKWIMATCKSLRALGSYVHLTVWAANRNAKFTMFLNTTLKAILMEARVVLKKRGLEIPAYFDEAIKSMGKQK